MTNGDKLRAMDENCSNCRHIRVLEYDARNTGLNKTGWRCVLFGDKTVTEIKLPALEICECFEMGESE